MKKKLIGPPPRRGRNGAPKAVRELPIGRWLDVCKGTKANWYAAAKAVGATVTVERLENIGKQRWFRVWRTG